MLKLSMCLLKYFEQVTLSSDTHMTW